MDSAEGDYGNFTHIVNLKVLGGFFPCTHAMQPKDLFIRIDKAAYELNRAGLLALRMVHPLPSGYGSMFSASNQNWVTGTQALNFACRSTGHRTIPYSQRKSQLLGHHPPWLASGLRRTPYPSARTQPRPLALP